MIKGQQAIIENINFLINADYHLSIQGSCIQSSSYLENALQSIYFLIFIDQMFSVIVHTSSSFHKFSFLLLLYYGIVVYKCLI